MNTIDMSFRPETYWPESLTPYQLLSRIRGKTRQQIARRIYEREGFRGLNEFLVKEGLNDEERSAWGGVGPWCLGGEFLPGLYEGEVEIARISMASTTRDQISVRALRLDGAIHYRIVGEYEEDESMRHELPFQHSEQPLTLRELIDLIDGACTTEPYCPGGILTSNWTTMRTWGYQPVEIIGFLSLSSPFYPQLDDCYQALAESWIEDNEEHEYEDE
jgi:hypothetical protein